MGWFRKRDDGGARQAKAIAEFWRSWGQVRSDVVRAISGGDPSAFIGDLTMRVEAIKKGLEWELTRGITAEHGLVVTAAGNPELRSATARWLAAAPPVDETWEYHRARSADARVLSSTLKLGEDVSVDLALLGYGIAVDRERRQIDVTCYHPMFGQLSREAQAKVTFLSLDWLLGEETSKPGSGRSPGPGRRPAI